MSVNYKDFIESAESILASAGGEVCYRNSISRSYYSVFHAALGHADSVSVPPVSAVGGSTHKKLREFYTQGYKSKKHKLEIIKIGYNLLRLHGMRCTADYELDVEISKVDADMHVALCQEIIGLVKWLETESAAS